MRKVDCVRGGLLQDTREGGNVDLTSEMVYKTCGSRLRQDTREVEISNEYPRRCTRHILDIAVSVGRKREMDSVRGGMLQDTRGVAMSGTGCYKTRGRWIACDAGCYRTSGRW